MNRKLMYIDKAVTIAMIAHMDQTDKLNIPYILHPLSVMNSVEGMEHKATAILHDVVEDSDYTIPMLRNMGIPVVVVDAVDCITKRDGEDYFVYLARVKSNPIALVVKLADIYHNTNPKRLGKLGGTQSARLCTKYAKALKYLLDK